MSTVTGSIKSKMSWFALILVVLGALQQNMDAVTAVIGAENIGMFTSASGIIVYILRVLTTKPLSEK